MKKKPSEIPKKHEPEKDPQFTDAEIQNGFASVIEKEIAEWETWVYKEVLTPEKASVTPDADTDDRYDLCYIPGEPTMSRALVARKAIGHLANAARQGEPLAVKELLATTCKLVWILNELADTESPAKKHLQVMASREINFPQFVGKHPDVIADSQERMQRLTLGSKAPLKNGKWSNRQTDGQPWRTVIGGYIERTKEAIDSARRNLPEFSISDDVQCPQWVREAGALAPDPKTWGNFALRILKMINGGTYPDDFIARGESNARSHVANSPNTKKARDTIKNQAVIAAEKAWRKAWKTRF